MGEQFNVLVSSAGRRVGLMRLFRSALADLGVQGALIATDTSPYAAAWQEADRRFLVPPCTSPGYIERLLEICRHNDVKLVVPTIDTELPILAAHRDDFQRDGVTVLVSSEATIDIAADKALTHRWLAGQGFPTVRQGAVADAIDRPDAWPLPLIAKPARGSASIGLVRVHDRSMLEPLRGHDDYIVESVAKGEEHTVDVLINKAGGVVCTVPRRRLEVRAGEVSKGVTVRDQAMEALARQIGASLPGAYGVINVQMFRAPDGTLSVFEINARFGGGYPLSSHAGADFPKWIIEELRGTASLAGNLGWRSGVGMLRYDAEVFIDIADGLPVRAA